MIGIDEKNTLVEALTQKEIPKNTTLHKTARVERIANNGIPILIFDGEDSPSQQEYRTFNETYIPKIGDRVLLLNIGGEYFIAGRAKSYG